MDTQIRWKLILNFESAFSGSTHHASFYPPFTITFRVSEKLIWEEEDYVNPSGVEIQILKKGTNVRTTVAGHSYLKDYLAEVFEDWDFPAREKEMKKLNQEIKYLLKEMKQLEEKLGLGDDVIWDYAYHKCAYG